MIKEHRISYGCCYNASSNPDLKNQIHHIWDSGLTGAGIAGRGHSEHSLCGHAPAYDNHLYVLDMPISMAKDFLSPVVLEDQPVKFCMECLGKLYEYIEKNNIKRIPHE